MNTNTKSELSRLCVGRVRLIGNEYFLEEVLNTISPSEFSIESGKVKIEKQKGTIVSFRRHENVV